MNIYIGHSLEFDFQAHFYEPIKESPLIKAHEFVFPHEDPNTPFDSYTYLHEEADCMLVELSYPCTIMGIEMGWASSREIPIIGLHRSNVMPALPIYSTCGQMVRYLSPNDLVSKLEVLLD